MDQKQRLKIRIAAVIEEVEELTTEEAELYRKLRMAEPGGLVYPDRVSDKDWQKFSQITHLKYEVLKPRYESMFEKIFSYDIQAEKVTW